MNIHNEKGQALPMAIMALLIGALVVVPFLSHAGTSLLDSGIYAGEIAARNSSDAGVEHAIWNLTDGGLAAQIPLVGNQKTYQLGEVLNGKTTSITVTTKAVSSGSGIVGDIGNAIIDSLIFDASAGYTPDVIQVNSTVCAIAYRGPSNRGYLVTMSVADDGSISNSVIDTLIFDTSACYEPDIIHVSGDYYAVAYRGNGNDGYIITASIAANGAIGNSVTSSLRFDSAGCYEPDVVNVSGIYYAIAYRGSANDGFLKTVTISAAGIIGASVISTNKFEKDCYTPSIIPVSGTIYAIAYRGNKNKGSLITMSVSSSGIISANALDTFVFDAAAGYEPVITNVSTGIYAIAYRGSNNGSLKTVSITSSGIFGSTILSTFAFENTTSNLPDIVQVSSNTFAIVYGNSTNKGFLKTITIAASGAVTQTAIDTFNFDSSAGFEPTIIYLTGNIYGIAYRGTSNRGIFITIGIVSSSGTPKSSYEILSTAGGTTIRALVDTQNSTASIVSWFVN